MDRIFYGNENYQSKDRNFQTFYYLLKKKSKGYYGIGIWMSEYDQREKEECFFTEDLSHAEELLQRFKRNLVTPVSLSYLLDDLSE